MTASYIYIWSNFLISKALSFSGSVLSSQADLDVLSKAIGGLSQTCYLSVVLGLDSPTHVLAHIQLTSNNVCKKEDYIDQCFLLAESLGY